MEKRLAECRRSRAFSGDEERGAIGKISRDAVFLLGGRGCLRWIGLHRDDVNWVARQTSEFLPEPRTENSPPIWYLQQGIWAD